MPKEARTLTKRLLDALRRKAEADPDLEAYLADASQPGLYARARRGRVELVFVF